MDLRQLLQDCTSYPKELWMMLMVTWCFSVKQNRNFWVDVSQCMKSTLGLASVHSLGSSSPWSRWLLGLFSFSSSIHTYASLLSSPQCVLHPKHAPPLHSSGPPSSLHTRAQLLFFPVTSLSPLCIQSWDLVYHILIVHLWDGTTWKITVLVYISMYVIIRQPHVHHAIVHMQNISMCTYEDGQ